MKQGVVIVTGGSRGIGAATSRLLAQRGYGVVVNYAGNVDAATAVVRDIENNNGVAIAVRADVSDEGEVEHVFAAADRMGPLVGLVNNAGIINKAARLEEMTATTINRLLAVNITGSLLCAKAAVLRMSTKRGGQGGAIVNLTSGAAKLGAPGAYLDYAASKGAIDSFTIGLALEVASEGIRGQCGSTRRHRYRFFTPRAAIRSARRGWRRACRWGDRAPLTRWPRPSCGCFPDDASYTTGTTIAVSGGRAIQP